MECPNCGDASYDCDDDFEQDASPFCSRQCRDGVSPDVLKILQRQAIEDSMRKTAALPFIHRLLQMKETPVRVASSESGEDLAFPVEFAAWMDSVLRDR